MQADCRIKESPDTDPMFQEETESEPCYSLQGQPERDEFRNVDPAAGGMWTRVLKCVDAAEP